MESYELELCHVQKIDGGTNSSFCLILRKAGEIAGHDSLTSGRHVQCFCFDSTSSVVFPGVSFNANKLYWTLWVEYLHDHPFAFL